MKIYKFLLFIAFSGLIFHGCNHLSYRTYEVPDSELVEIPDPDYNITLNEDYEYFVEYMFLGNRSENFSTYFNKFFSAEEAYEEAMTELEAAFISSYNPKLDSLDQIPSVAAGIKDKFNKVIELGSKILQFHKDTRYLDDAVLLIGKSYYNMQEYIQAERKFEEFLSKLTESSLYDEAILYLARTKMKMRKKQDGETILRNLLAKTENDEIKSSIYEELAILSLTKKDFPAAIDQFTKSIDFTSDSENKARKLFILAKIYTLIDISKAVGIYERVIDNTSNFDLEFYAKLNKAIVTYKTGKYDIALEELEKMSRKYRDYPELKQNADFEIANIYFLTRKFDLALNKYYDVIIDFAGTKAAADSYYYIGSYYENEKGDYFNAAVNYKKSSETFPGSEFAAISLRKFNNFDRYFTLKAELSDTTKTDFPTENPELEKYRKIKEENKPGSERKEQEFNFPGKEKGSGGFRNPAVYDSTENTGEGNDPVQKINLPLDTTLEKNLPLDTTLKKELPKDTIIDWEQRARDSLITAERIEDSTRTAKIEKRFSLFFELAELFYFNMQLNDSAEYYLDYIVANDINDLRKARASFMLALIYKAENNNEKVESIYREIIEKYPGTDVANECRRILGLELLDLTEDKVEIAYANSMTELGKNNPEKAVEILKTVLSLNPDNEKLPKIYYALGWIYENNLMNLDSSVKYYKLLKEKFPSSVYTISIIAKLDVIAPEKIENTPKDTLKLKTDTTVVLNDSITGNLIVKDSLTNDLIELPPEDSSFIPLPKDTTIRQNFIEQ